MGEPGGKQGHVRDTLVQSVQAGYNACRLRDQYEVDDSPVDSSAAGQCWPQADQAALADVTTSPSSDSSQTLKPRPEGHHEPHTGHHILKGEIDYDYAHHWVDLPTPIG